MFEAEADAARLLARAAELLTGNAAAQKAVRGALARIHPEAHRMNLQRERELEQREREREQRERERRERNEQ